jgi:type IV pilus assembly protein PilX
MSMHPFNPSLARLQRRQGQQGVVLIVALIMLVIISILATVSVRNATSSEAVSGNVRTTQLATQAAEIALRYCEEGVEQISAPTPTVALTPLAYQDPPRWKTMSNWDGSSSVTANLVVMIPTTSLGGTSTFKRPPECMVEAMQVVNASGVLTTTSTFLVTARGFGPEVPAADSTRSRPTGSEVWMQSTVELE